MVVSGRDSRLTAARIHEESNSNIAAHNVFFCGPSAMRESLKSELCALGLKRGAFHYEEFEIRSGIGMRKMLSWLLERYGHKFFSS